MNNKQILQMMLEDFEEEELQEIDEEQKLTIINELQNLADKKDASDTIPLEYNDWKVLYEHSIMECMYNTNPKIAVQKALKKAPISILIDNNIGFDMIIPIEEVRKPKIKINKRKKNIVK